MPLNTEKIVNAKLAEGLRGKYPGWRIGAEQTQVFVERAKQPDIVVSHASTLTVIVESEFAPASRVEADARSRLGSTIKGRGEEIEQSVAIKLPASLRSVDQKDLDTAVQAAQYSFAIFTMEGEGLFDGAVRWPSRGWLEGDLDMLAGCIESVALSERRVARGGTVLEVAVREAAGNLEFRTPTYILERLAKMLHQEAGEQTTRMAVAILANAVIFHTRLARLHPKVPDLASCKAPSGPFLRGNVVDTWRQILEINYWPIFKLALELLRILPQQEVQTVMARLHRMSEELQQFGAMDIQDLSGRMFQRLISDRKFLATFYTLPSSATLLAELAVSRLDADWSDPKSITALRVADLACGTGALMGAAYQAIASRHRRQGGDDAALHMAMMEEVLTAADIMPAAVHLTASTLSGMHPGKPFGYTRMINMPYGEQETGLSIGSLDLIQADETRALFGTGRKGLHGQGMVQDERNGEVLEVLHGSMDMVLMNPPFTRPTNHESTEVPVPSFAGFWTKGEEQRRMAQRLAEIRQGLDRPAGHGNAGIASNFIDLGHAKLAAGGVLALVLPASFVQGHAWRNAQALLRRCYRDILVVGIASAKSDGRAFSADTGMAEVLVVARKGKTGSEEVFAVNLLNRPRTLLEASTVARVMEDKRRDAGDAAGRLWLTDEQDVGSYLRSSGWSGIGVRQTDMIARLEALARGELLLPRMRSSVPLPLCPLKDLGNRGYLHRDINGRGPDGEARGPFDIEPMQPSPEYPVLWAHDAKRERSLVVAPDSQGRPRTGCSERAAQLWHDGASRLHFNLDFRLNSQALAACLTESRSVGGRAWPNFIVLEDWEKAIVLWANTTLGLINFWWTGTRQQQGRTILTISRLPKLVSLDASKLTAAQLVHCKEIFAEFRDKAMLPANEAYRDEVRQALDCAVLIDLLGLDAELLDGLKVLRDQWCSEPSVHGGKVTRMDLRDGR